MTVCVCESVCERVRESVLLSVSYFFQSLCWPPWPICIFIYLSLYLSLFNPPILLPSSPSSSHALAFTFTFTFSSGDSPECNEAASFPFPFYSISFHFIPLTSLCCALHILIPCRLVKGYLSAVYLCIFVVINILFHFHVVFLRVSLVAVL